MLSTVVTGVKSASDPTRVGYGRDGDEAVANAGWAEIPEDLEWFELEVRDNIADKSSASVASVVCDYHMTEDQEVPEAVKQRLRAFIAQGQFASAVEYCFEAVWDRGFEADLPPDQRKYT